MDAREDYERTVQMLGDLALYAHLIGADLDFVDAIGPALAASLPCGYLPPLPSGYDPNDGPDYPGCGWRP
ncbi:hypothetical protein AB0J57_15875 [Streptomyces sp. NPDC049837]|uniref:hypothetical protein n=1 Tax=Streptomyces sp. NPDC049837 TaxID=3155277 RepID=UPI00341E33E4